MPCTKARRGRAAGECEPAHHKTYVSAQRFDKFLVMLERPHLEPESRLLVVTELPSSFLSGNLTALRPGSGRDVENPGGK